MTHLRIGHRGAAGHAPENTVESFERAIVLGCDLIETDLRATSDGEIVLCHDAWIGSLEVSATPLRDLPPLLTVRELLDQCRGRVGLMLELKVTGIVDRVVDLAREFPGPVIYASFHHDEVRRARDCDPNASTLALIAGAPVDRARFVIDARATHAGIHVEFADATFVDALHNAGAKVFVYTANEPAEIDQLIACGVDGIISDYPDRVPRAGSR